MAIDARATRDFQKAEEILLSIADSCASSASFFAVLGHMQWENQRIQEAIASFHRALTLNPNLEEASLGLFHCRLKNNQIDEAFEELRRFLFSNQSQEYSRLLSEINSNAIT
jgi:tetratricopeptide (TPR) repeat protein